MKRDWFILGELFTKLEDECLEEYLTEMEDKERQQVYLRHLRLLVDAGYIKDVYFSGSQVNLRDARITLSGYDFAEMVQDKKLLNKTVGLIKSAGLIVSKETLKQFTPVAVKFFVNLTTGA